MLWDNRKLDLLMIGSVSSGPGHTVMFPVGFKDEFGQEMTVRQVLAAFASRPAKEHGDVSLDIFLSKQEHARRNELDS